MSLYSSTIRSEHTVHAQQDGKYYGGRRQTLMPPKKTPVATEFLNTAYTDIESMWYVCKTTITDIITKRVPFKLTCSKYTNPLMNHTIKRTIRRKQKAFKKARKSNSKRDRDRYKRLQKEVQWDTRRARRRYIV